MHRFTLLLGLVFCFLCAAESGATEIPKGTWSGTIGNNKVQVCFSNDEFLSYGTYYYIRHKAGIYLNLKPNEQNLNFSELEESVGDIPDVTGVWKLSLITKDRLQGVWINLHTQEQLPIDLKHISDLKKSQVIGIGICDDAFYAPIVNSLHYSYGTGKLRDKVYKTVKTDTGVAFEVPKTDKNADKINAFIQFWLKQHAIENYRCQLCNGKYGKEKWEKTLEPVFWSKKWLVMKGIVQYNFCCGAHDNNPQVDNHTFNLNTGERVNVWLWLKAKKEYVYGKKDDEDDKDEFVQLIEKLEKLNSWNDCYSLPFSLKEPYPTMQGLVFRTIYDYPAKVCESDILISYKDITPYLTPLGRKAVKSILQAK